MDAEARALIDALQLTPLAHEGGYYRRVYESPEWIPAEGLPARYQGVPHPFSTVIYYLYVDAPDGFSHLHRLPTDEIFHFYQGDPVEMLILHPDGRVEYRILGPRVLEGQHIQVLVPAGCWQGSRLLAGGRYALAGTTMTPGYVDSDFELGDAQVLEAAYPQAAELIRALCRPF